MCVSKLCFKNKTNSNKNDLKNAKKNVTYRLPGLLLESWLLESSSSSREVANETVPVPPGESAVSVGLSRDSGPPGVEAAWGLPPVVVVVEGEIMWKSDDGGSI